MNVNWRVRTKNKVFWLAMIPAILLLIQQVGGVFGLTIDLTGLQEQLLAIVETIFLLLGILGIVVDPTTKGTGDSIQAMEYTEPK